MLCIPILLFAFQFPSHLGNCFTLSVHQYEWLPPAAVNNNCPSMRNSHKLHSRYIFASQKDRDGESEGFELEAYSFVCIHNCNILITLKPLIDSCQRFIEKFDEFCSFNSTHVSALMLNMSQKKFRKLSLHKSDRKLTASKMCCSISVVEKNLPKGEYSAKIEVSQNVSFTN